MDLVTKHLVPPENPAQKQEHFFKKPTPWSDSLQSTNLHSQIPTTPAPENEELPNDVIETNMLNEQTREPSELGRAWDVLHTEERRVRMGMTSPKQLTRR